MRECRWLLPPFPDSSAAVNVITDANLNLRRSFLNLRHLNILISSVFAFFLPLNRFAGLSVMVFIAPHPSVKALTPRRPAFL
ncbi:hypothetical protein NEILACOT_03463 [Neisseria lactamica ATCC 23970]|uniref:Uncharacterized protein n=2 Tax=Neisseria lactamica TaxID=486 RepID=D0W7G4_NEILA|nr:hypothetical protein NEILACOT_03463 [Neisseria lactamica ATCC 23970]